MTASRSEMRAEAAKRMMFLQVSPTHISAFREHETIPRTIDGIAAVEGTLSTQALDQIQKIEEEEHVLIFYVIDTEANLYDENVGYVRTYLFVSEDKDSWDETYSLTLGDETAITTQISWANPDWTLASPLPTQLAYRHVHVKSYFGSLVRTK